MRQQPTNNSEKDTARPKFYQDAVQNNAKSEKEGRPIFDEKEMVEVKIPGDKLFSWVGEVEDRHRIRWPEQYAAFKRGEQRAASGTPLEQWPNPTLTKGRVLELKAANILSVEELASVPDNILPKLGMGARELREQARTWIAKAKEGASTSALSAEVARLTEMVNRLTAGNVPAVAPVPAEKQIEDCTDDELKTFIERETGEKPRVNASRKSLLDRCAEIASAKSEAA